MVKEPVQDLLYVQILTKKIMLNRTPVRFYYNFAVGSANFKK